MPKQTPQELRDHLDAQVGFLDASAKRFDAGHEAEAARLATVIRVLLHDTRASKSLLAQLGVKHTLRYVDTALDVEPSSRAATNGLSMIMMSGGDAKYFPPLGDLGPRRANKSPKQFDEWWTVAVVKDADGRTFSRKDLILALAHQDGGAHVDPELDAAYAALSRSNSLGGVFTGASGISKTLGSPVLASVRQIVYEIIQTIQHLT